MGEKNYVNLPIILYGTITALETGKTSFSFNLLLPLLKSYERPFARQCRVLRGHSNSRSDGMDCAVWSYIYTVQYFMRSVPTFLFHLSQESDV